MRRMIIVTFFFFLSKQHILDHVSIYFNCCFYVFSLVGCASLYPSTRSSSCIFINCILINLKQRPVKITGKNIKSYATAQVHFPWEREGSLTVKSPNLSFKIWYGLTVHIIRFKISQANYDNKSKSFV